MKRPTLIPGLPGLASRAMVLLGVVAAILTTGITISAIHAGSRPTGVEAAAPAMMEVAPGGLLPESEVSESLRVHYEAAEEHADVFASVPCHCGCDRFLGHRHLLDCFVRPDGSGWEAHAAGCGVCLGEAIQVEQLIASGVTDADEIRAAIDAQWGDPYQTG